MSRQPSLRPKSYIPGYPDAMYNLAAVTTLTQLESRAGLADEKHDQRVFRVKRKHVLKACDRCRVKKTKVCEALVVPRILCASFSTMARACGLR
ncbi:hypothetical protein BO82DRAFT_352793 [Aspergillus uvarum CBS 121591]|uniref:Uncharacterized protein n=1 Tax=Aspergillus uvarum CBS 121591 TaxID=1448315 RepID=A0A319CD39_9EURO|nr:hypothetical protein BO82DRAFT_352793 [Aspergillus uvarum CBS 121591]PYH83726.1 hypothetical protein BO82DRAFT_352793 [Aspergillus uvarum CBS 121591]